MRILVFGDSIGWEDVKTNYSFCTDLKKYDTYKTAEKIKISTLVIHGGADRTVPPSQSRELHEWIKGSELKIVENGNHYYEGSLPVAVNIITTWFKENMK